MLIQIIHYKRKVLCLEKDIYIAELQYPANLL